MPAQRWTDNSEHRRRSCDRRRCRCHTRCAARSARHDTAGGPGRGREHEVTGGRGDLGVQRLPVVVAVGGGQGRDVGAGRPDALEQPAPEVVEPEVAGPSRSASPPRARPARHRTAARGAGHGRRTSGTSGSLLAPSTARRASRRTRSRPMPSPLSQTLAATTPPGPTTRHISRARGARHWRSASPAGLRHGRRRRRRTAAPRPRRRGRRRRRAAHGRTPRSSATGRRRRLSPPRAGRWRRR